MYPVEYGADPTGAQESSEAILKAVGDAFGILSELELVAGVKDLGGVVIDLQGGNYTISKPITFPSSGGGNIVVRISLLLLFMLGFFVYFGAILLLSFGLICCFTVFELDQASFSIKLSKKKIQLFHKGIKSNHYIY